jgi:transcriptional regulator with GAF, ATPase, and Fis domain
MSSQHIRPITHNSPTVQNPFARDSKLLYSKIANISHLVESLNSAVEDLGSVDVPQLNEQFDFYNEVQRFEINLIQSALRISGGSQVKAAKLLKLNPTTLNAKLKLFGLNTK